MPLVCAAQVRESRGLSSVSHPALGVVTSKESRQRVAKRMHGLQGLQGLGDAESVSNSSQGERDVWGMQSLMCAGVRCRYDVVPAVHIMDTHLWYVCKYVSKGWQG